MNCTSCYICLVIFIELLQVLYSDLHLLSSVATACWALAHGTSCMCWTLCFCSKVGCDTSQHQPSENHAGESPAPAWDKPHHPLQPHLPIGCLLETWSSPIAHHHQLDQSAPEAVFGKGLIHHAGSHTKSSNLSTTFWVVLALDDKLLLLKTGLTDMS